MKMVALSGFTLSLHYTVCIKCLKIISPNRLMCAFDHVLSSLIISTITHNII